MRGDMSRLLSPLAGEGAPKEHRIRVLNSVGMRGIFLASGMGGRRPPHPIFTAERRKNHPLPQGERVNPVVGGAK